MPQIPPSFRFTTRRHIVYAEQVSCVRNVIVNTRLLVKDRELLNIGIDNIIEKVMKPSKIIKRT